MTITCWSTNRFQKDIKQHVILAFKTRVIAVKSRFYSDFFIHIRLTAKLYLLIVIIRSFSATEIATQKQTLKKRIKTEPTLAHLNKE